jgi:hypothetical protein
MTNAHERHGGHDGDDGDDGYDGHGGHEGHDGPGPRLRTVEEARDAILAAIEAPLGEELADVGA